MDKFAVELQINKYCTPISQAHQNFDSNRLCQEIGARNSKDDAANLNLERKLVTPLKPNRYTVGLISDDSFQEGSHKEYIV